MSDKAHAELIKLLTEDIRKYDHYYFNENTSLISDEEYDRLFEQLKAAEEQFPHLKQPDSPTNRISAPLTSNLKRLPIPIPMMSLGKLYREEDLGQFIKRIRQQYGESTQITFEPKYDGLAVRLVYKNGILKEATTRGDGTYGEDILQNVLRIRGVPHRLKNKQTGTLEVRGEVVADLVEFHRFNEQLEKIGQRPYRNARNFVSGNLRQLNPKNVYGEAMVFVAYDVVEGMDFRPFYSDRMIGLSEHDFTICNFGFVSSPTSRGIPVEDILMLYQSSRAKHWCEIDGVVFKVDDIVIRQQLGVTSKHPKWAVAYKFEPMSATTRIEKIEVTVGRTGALTPVAKVSPVKVAGVTVTSVNLHNFDKIKDLNLDVGDTVRLVRAGDVIPHVDKVLEKGGNAGCFLPPNQCPCCGSQIIQKEDQVELYCGGEDCPVKLLGRLIYFASRDCADIQLLGETYIEGLFEKGHLKRPADIYCLTEKQLLDVMPGKVARKVLANIEKSKGMSLERFITVLGIPNVGESTARLIAARFRTFDGFIAADPEGLWGIKGIGDITARSVYKWLNDVVLLDDMKRMKEMGVTTGETNLVNEGPLTGQVWCITGSFNFMSRPDIKKLLLSRGAKVVSNVTKQTTHLLMGDNPGNKYDLAVKNNCLIMNCPGFTEETVI